MKKGKGFTLIEVLLAIALGGALLTAVMVHVFSLAAIWQNSGDGDYFDQHVDGVVLFLSNTFAMSEGLESVAQEEEDRNETEEESQIEPVIWGRPPGYSDFEDPLLTFRLKESPPLFTTGEFPMPGVTCHLYFHDRDGLSLLWYSRFSKVENINDVNRTLISPYVTEIEYCYYDTEFESWDIESDPKEDRDGQFLLPDFIKLRFEYEDVVKEMPIYMPRRNQNVPLF